MQSDVLGVQEAHGTLLDMERYIERQGLTHQGGATAHEQADTGGNLLFAIHA